LETELRR